MSADTAKKSAETTRGSITSDVVVNSPIGPTKPSKTPSSPCVLPILEGRVVKNDEKSQTATVAEAEDVLNSEKTFITGGSDFIPMDILNSLTKVPTPPTREQLGPPNRYKKLGPIENVTQVKRRPANVWNYSKARDKFKHLIDHPPCMCGAGRDISFLYDAVTQLEKSKQSAGATDKKVDAIVRVSREEKKSQPRNLEEFHKAITAVAVTDAEMPSNPDQIEPHLIPSTLVPSEYHIVKNPGVMGLEFHDDKYSTYVEDHEDHLTIFPSMAPSGRQEVMKLKHSMNAMLSRAGVDDDAKELTGPTQIHSLLELMKKEQTIYNICFNEIIRQVTVDCAERGELLANLRKRYAALLDRVPRQVRSLHQEVVAQRALDRRLTEELVRFKSSISVLTSDLATVRAHDREVTQQAIEAKTELREALNESKKNASLLAEYHDLYELQRNRLESQVGNLTEERDLWASAAYTLALKVTDKHSLSTAKKLHLCEKAWSKLARHFAIFLSDKDSVQLERLTNHVQQWRTLTEKFNKGLVTSEQETRNRLQSLNSKMDRWNMEFRRILNFDDGTVRRPGKNLITSLFEDLKHVEEVFSQEAEQFTGETLLSREEELYNMNKQVDSWTEVSLKIFNRHQTPDGEKWPQHEVMKRLNGEVDKIHQQYHVRVIGENGVAKGMIDLANPIETWISKLNSNIRGGGELTDSEWFRLGDFICTEWKDQLTKIIDLIGSTLKEGERSIGDIEDRVDVEILIKDVMKWLSATTNGIDSEDGKIVERVSIIHSTMIRWMVTVLLRLAPDMKDETLKGIATEETESSIGAGEILLQSTSEEIFSRSDRLFDVLRTFSSHVTKSCSDLVLDLMQERRDKGDELAELDFKELKRLGAEGENWIRTAELLRREVVGDAEPTSPEIEMVSPLERGMSAIPSTESGEDGRQTSVDSDRPQTGYTTYSASSQKNEPRQPFQLEVSTPQSGDQRLPDVVTTPADEETSQADDQERSGETGVEPSEDVGEVDESRVHVIGHDDNIRTKSLTNLPSDQDAEFLFIPEGDTVPARSPTPDTRKALEALAAVERLQTQLLETEERAQVSEERAIQAETELKQALEKIRAFERSASRASSATHSVVERQASSTSKTTTSSAHPTPRSRSSQKGSARKK